jgi:hypothetical protein
LILDLEQVNALSADDRTRYMQLEKLFSQPGWKLVMALAAQNATNALRNAAVAASWDQNRMAIGNHVAWQAIANLEKETQDLYAGKAAGVLQAKELKHLSDEQEFE